MNYKEDHFNFIQKTLFYLFESCLTDKQYANALLRRWYGSGNINSPKTFNEKIQWLKINDKNPLYTSLSDKLGVRDYVINKLKNSEVLNNLYYVWERVEDIDFSILPDSFVLKATHGSGMNIIVKDKNKINYSETISRLNKWMKIDYSKFGREWNYKHIPRKIICEKLLLDENGKIPQDFKVFCFNGEPRFISVDVDRFISQKRVFYNLNWEKQNFEILHPQYSGEIKKPTNLDEILGHSKILASNIPFVRVDWYLIPQVVFGEMTFYPGNGTEPIIPSIWDKKLGDLIDISLIKNLK